MVLIPHQVLDCDVPDYEDQSRTYALGMRSSERYRCPKGCMERFALVFVGLLERVRVYVGYQPHQKIRLRSNDQSTLLMDFKKPQSLHGIY